MRTAVLSTKVRVTQPTAQNWELHGRPHRSERIRGFLCSMDTSYESYELVVFIRIERVCVLCNGTGVSDCVQTAVGLAFSSGIVVEAS